jgi:16S rRNA (cytosine967-C5)-methyltransferase
MLRRKASSGWLMDDPSPRGVLIGMLRIARGLGLEAIAALFSGERFAPTPLSGREHVRLAEADLESAPAPIRGDYPEWLDGHFARSFGDDRAREVAALAERAPLDLRVNTLKTIRLKALPALADYGAVAGAHGPDAIRIPPSADGRFKPVQSDPLFIKGMIEIQDEGSQIVARLAGAQPGQQVLDLCAGGGGKSLALAASMNNTGQIYATDNDPRRLAPIHERLERAGARNVQVRTPRGRQPAIDDLAGRVDLVLVDAPCTGVGTWRRNPDAKWRLRPGALTQRILEQDAVLDAAARAVKPGGTLAYVTCSLLAEENSDRIEAFLARDPRFELTDPLAANDMPELDAASRPAPFGRLLTPLRTGTDGFFLARLRRLT